MYNKEHAKELRIRKANHKLQMKDNFLKLATNALIIKKLRIYKTEQTERVIPINECYTKEEPKERESDVRMY